jgi:vitamin B12 transporter
MKKEIFIVAAVLFSSQLQAQKDSTQVLDEVVVTANKYPQKQSSTGKVLTVISQDQLERNTGRTLTQVLNEQAGIVINGSQNALGTNQLLYMRGAGAASTLILVDGVPANDASGITSEFDLNQFTVDQVERVEILKGSQSVLYGSDAMAGVINIITKKSTAAKPLAFNATVAAGTYNTLKANAGIGGQVKALTYNLQYSRLQSDGFSAAQDVNGNGGFDNDGFEQNALAANIGIAVAKNWKLRLLAQAGKYSASIDDAAFTDDKNNRIENKNLQLGLASVYQFTKGTLTVNLNLNNTDRTLEDKRNIPDDPNDFDPFEGLYKGRSFFAEAYSNIELHRHLGILVGTDVRRQTATIATTYGNLGADSLKATQVSGYASLLVKSLGGFNAELGGRFTNHSEFGSAVTYSINPSYTIHKQVKLFANIATGFRSPTLYNLASEYGNSELKPERSNSYEAGVQFLDKANKANIRFTYFNRILKDVIIFKTLFAPPYAQYDNADKQKDHGFEVEASLRPAEKWSITANYSYVDGKIETLSKSTGKDTSYYNLYRRPKNTFNTTIGYQATKKLYAGIGFRWVDKRQDPYFNPGSFETEIKELKAFYNADLYVSYQAATGVKVFADFRNITDRTYFDLYGYNSRRFNFMAGAIVNF